MEHDALLRILHTRDAWLATPDCAQLAADTFGRPVAVYPSQDMQNKDEMFFPIIGFEYLHNIPLPLVLQNHGNTHWVTVRLKRAIKPNWPIPTLWHTKAILKMGHRIRAYWKKVLSFNRPLITLHDREQASKALPDAAEITEILQLCF